VDTGELRTAGAANVAAIPSTTILRRARSGGLINKYRHAA